MDMLITRPTWLAALLPFLAMWQYGDRNIVRGELYRMALSADAAAQSADALKRIASMLDREENPTDMRGEELRSIACTALAAFDRVPPSAPVAILVECHLPAYRSQSSSGIKEPGSFRHIGATALPA